MRVFVGHDWAFLALGCPSTEQPANPFPCAELADGGGHGVVVQHRALYRVNARPM